MNLRIYVSRDAGAVAVGAEEVAAALARAANKRGVAIESLGALKPDPSRLAERWFMGIGEDDTPTTSAVSKVTETWVLEWQAARAEGGAS